MICKQMTQYINKYGVGVMNSWRSMCTNWADDLINADSMAPAIMLNER